MRTLKKSWLRAGITLIVLVTGIFFVVKGMEKGKEQESFANQWFEFIGTSIDSPTDPTKYRLIGEGEPMPSCTPGDQVCALNAPVGSNNEPIISSSLQVEIANATSNEQHSTNVKVRQ